MCVLIGKIACTPAQFWQRPAWLMAHPVSLLHCAGNSAAVISSPQVLVCLCLEIRLGWLKIELTTSNR